LPGFQDSQVFREIENSLASIIGQLSHLGAKRDKTFYIYPVQIIIAILKFMKISSQIFLKKYYL